MSSLDNPAHLEAGDTRRFSDVDKKDSPQHVELANDADSTHLEKVAANIEDIATSVDNIPVSMFVWLVALTASTAGMLFGYDTGIISAAELYLGTDLDNRLTTSNEKEMITSLCSAGAFVGAIFAGNTADKVRVDWLHSWSSSGLASGPSILMTIASSDAKWPSTSAVPCS